MDVGGLYPGTRIYFYLRAINAFGVSDWSEPCAILTPPAPAQLQTLAVEADRVSLRCDEPYNTTTGRIYQLERMTGNDGPWQPLGEISVNYIDQAVENGLTYRYRVTTSNASGEAISNIVEVVIPPRPLPVLWSDQLSARHGSGPSIILRWWFGRYERGYRIERRTEGSAWTAIVEIPSVTDLNYVEHEDSSVIPDTVYWYRVVYFNETGETISTEARCRAAETATLVTEDFEPGIDGTVWEDTSDGEWVEDAAAPGNHVLRLSAKESATVTLKPLDTSAGGWIRFRCRGTAAPDLDENGNQPYLWIYGTDSEGFPVYAGEVRPTELHPQEWRTYQFELPESFTSPASAISFEANWTGSGHWEIDDIEISAAIPRTAPQAVDTASLSSLEGGWSPPDLRWAVSADASGYVIERRTADTPWIVVGTHYMDSRLLFGGPQFYDLSARPSTTYFYRVIARNAAGDSPPSGELSYTTISSMEQWKRLQYGQDWNSPRAAWLEDNGTGTANLLRYAFNLTVDPWGWRDPLEPYGLPELAPDPETGLLCIRFIRYKEDWLPGVRYVVEFSDDATTWTPAGRLVEREPSSGKYERVTWQDDPPEVGEVRTRRFCRVRVTQD
jgi:hypothetical protein